MKGKHGKDSKWRKLMVLSLAVMMAIVFMPAGVLADGTAAQEQGSTKATVQENNASGTASGTENQPAVKQDTSEEAASQDDNTVQSGQEQSDTAQDTVKEASDTQTNEESKADKEANQISNTDVASVNGQGYATLQDAMKNAAVGDTITVLKDFTLTDQLAVDKAITLDLGGHTITNAVTGSQQAIKARMIDSLSIQNGTITGGSVGAVYAYKCNKLSLEKLTISGNNTFNNGSVYADRCGMVNVDKCTFENNMNRVFQMIVHDEESLTVSECIFRNNTGTQTVAAVSGNADKTFNNCSFTGNQGAGIISATAKGKTVTLNDCTVTGNKTKNAGTIKALASTALHLNSTIIKDNESQSEGVAAGVDTSNYSSITIEGNSAVYNNRNTSSAGYFNDFSSYSAELIKAVKKMKDPSGGIESFEDYTIDSKGTVKLEEGSQKPEAAIGDTTYMTLQDAITHAASGDTIKLIWTNTAGDIKDITLSGVKIDKELTLDLNGHNMHYRTMGSSDESSTLSVAKGGALTLVNTGEKKTASIGGRLRTENGAKSLSVGTGVKVNTIRVDDSNTAVTIDGSQGDLTLEGSLIEGKDNNPPITFGKNFQTDGTITFDLGSDITDKLNNNAEAVGDIQIAGGATQEIAGHVVLKGVNSPLVSLICNKDGKLLVHKEKANVLYLDPVNGKDNKSGLDTKNALGTVSGAINKVRTANSSNAKTLVMVMSTIKVSGTEKWSNDTGKEIDFSRYSKNNSSLVAVDGKGSSLTLSNIVLDGNAKMQTHSAIISVTNGGKLNIDNGTVLQNNRVNAINGFGGGVFASGENSTVNMEGGTIQNNQAVIGAGIYATNCAVVNMSDGIIKDNRAVTIEQSEDGFKGSGGGVSLYDGAEMNLSGGTISSNYAEEVGGGISVGIAHHAPTNHQDSLKHIYLTMTGGTIDGNTAGSCGGGVFVQASDNEKTYSIAKITRGHIINNKMDGSGTENNFFGGGGIYVNGYPTRNGVNYHDGELYLENAYITGNEASVAGGGYASCPSSTTNMYENNGSAIYGNNADDSQAKDIYISSASWDGNGVHIEDPVYTIPSVMNGNVPYHWKNDKGKEVSYDSLSGKLEGDSTLSLYTDAKPAENESDVLISGNTSATRGGGIGSNGSVYMGSAPRSTTSVTAQKTWKGTPASGVDQIQVELYRNVKGDEKNKTYIGYMNLSPDGQGNWTNKVKFENLPKKSQDGKDVKVYEYTVGERKIPGYDATVSQDEGTGVFTISNAPTPTPVTPTPTKRITVQKVWKLDDGGTRPDSVQVQLMKNGTAYGSPVTLSDSNNWTTTWDVDGSSNILWTAEEVNAPEGFTASQQTVGDKIIITNDDQKTKKNDPETPQTPDNPTTPNKPTNPKSSGGSGSGSNTPVSQSAQNTAITSTTPASSVPRTADSARLGTMLIMFGGAAAALAAVLVMKRRENK